MIPASGAGGPEFDSRSGPKRYECTTCKPVAIYFLASTLLIAYDNLFYCVLVDGRWSCGSDDHAGLIPVVAKVYMYTDSYCMIA